MKKPRASSSSRATTVGAIDEAVLAFTAGNDVVLDRALIEADCIGTAAHVTMLSRMPLKPRLIQPADAKQVIRELVAIMRNARKGSFQITLEDQDVHLAVERALTAKLGDLGKKIHTGRSRNDQVAVDLRLFTRTQLIDTLREGADLATALLSFAREHAAVPMVGRTHMQPGMPSSVGLWASAYAEALLDDLSLVLSSYDLNDKSPLGSAASYGVPLPIDRQLTSDLLGFSAPCHNVLYANNSRGKLESVVLMAMTQIMLTLSRLAQDLMLFTMPEFDYFRLPREFCTGSSIMPQKQNPDVMELIRARASRVQAAMTAACDLIKGAPSGYNRDVQEAKELFMHGLETTRACLRILTPCIERTEVNSPALLRGFTPDVFATDAALEKVAQGMPFRDAYHWVKQNLDQLASRDPHQAIAAKTHLGATAGLDFDALQRRVDEVQRLAESEWKDHCRAITKLLGVPYPSLAKT
ncbi:MAG TPA: argininosuccinate lyase [Pirellulaceae bacterium]|nr:argininosuccinate lyase [Pirellulaceae bacterium]